MTAEENLEIVPAERIGPYYLKWDLETLKKNLPIDYVVSEGLYLWGVLFEDYIIGIRKEDKQIDYITVHGKFRQHFKHKITCESTLGEIEEDPGPTEIIHFSDAHILPDYPGMEMYFEDEDEDEDWDDDDSWKKIKINRIAVVDPNFIWNEHFSYEDYERMERTKYECPFPEDKLVKKPEEENSQNQ